MKITTLVENTRLENRPDLSVEKGLSFHVSAMGKQILFDAGNGSKFYENAALLDVNIEEVDAAVVSHWHHDHGGGISPFLKKNTKAKVYLRQADNLGYAFKVFGLKFDVGLNTSMFSEAQERFDYISKFTEIYPNIFIVTDLSKKHSQPKGNRYLYTRNDSGYQLDAFDHELMMVVKEDDGLVIFTGCAHNGVLNMLETAVELFPDTRIKAVVGGFHLVGLPMFNTIGGTREDIEQIGRLLMRFPIDKLYTCHCTGLKAYGILKDVLGEQIEYLPTGRTIEI
ncbi:MBL fold metallo-hydrolase [uncultured Photobacterium sp.]|uniref:MBL fold metallo-hydrolase n=1 Tax=uncultured Photobacterium sp. TaxID=173973 RepID=UPI0026288071|nr:MBL fold metallo-hydrolase [uncultured Photobacterium sp.]